MIDILLEYLTNYFTTKENNNNSLIKSYGQLEALMKQNSPKLLYFIYRNKNKIHKILYDTDQILKLPPTLADKGLYNLFYIVLLIKSDIEIINYSYELDLIKIVNNIKNNSKKGTLTIFILALILMQLIDNYKSTEIYSEEEDKSFLDKVYDECEEIKNEFKNTFLKSMNLNINNIYIDKNSLDEIYIEIIKSLINNKKLEDYEHCSDILGQIELDKIDLTEKMIQDLIDVFNNENINEYLNEYEIKEVGDLFDEKKLNFYLTIFNYILKESIYIYNFNFLLKARNEILKIIKSESNIKLSQYLYNNDDSINNKKIKEKLNIILNKFCDNNYYINNYLNNTYKQLFEILQYYKDFYFYSKKQQIINIENYLNNKLTLSKEETNEYLQDYTEAEKLKKLRDIIYYFFWVKNPEYFDKKKENIKEKNEKAENEMTNYITKVETCVKMLEDDKFKKKMRKDDRIVIYNYYKDDEINVEKKSQIIPKNIKESFMEETKYMVQQKSNFDKVDNSNENNFSKNINEIEKINKNDDLDVKSTDDTEKDQKNLITWNDTIKVQKILRERGIWLCLKNGTMDIEDIYSNTKEIKEDIQKNNTEKPTEAEEKENPEIEEIEFIGIKNNEISKTKIDKNKKKIKQKDSIKLNGLTPKSCLNLDDTNQIIFCQEGAYHYQNLFGDIQSMDKKNISDDNCIGGIKINKNLIAFTSHINRHRINETDKISFYNPETKEVIKEIEGYYFNNTINDFGLGILTPSENNINNKILICACKNNEAKNGILLININYLEKYKGKEDESIKFIETGKFEAYTFCQLKTKNDTKTDYFLVGGYNEEKEKGEVKLYKNILNEKNKKEIDIKFITTLDLKKNDNSELNEDGIINYIIQTKKNKNVIICSDKNIHIFSEPDFEFDEELINNDENDDIDWNFLNNIKCDETIK